MRKVALVAAVISLLISATSASAEVAPTPSPTSTLSPAAQYVLDLENYREDFKNYKTARSIYDRQLLAIAIEFNKALERAAKDMKIAGKSAASRASLSADRAQAAITRDQAVAALGTPPVVPTLPRPPAKLQNPNKFKEQSPRSEKKG